MNRSTALFIFLAGGVIAAQGQTPAKPTSATHSAPSAHTAAHSTSAVKLPPGVPPATGPVVTAFSLRYQDIKIGDGPLAEPAKVYRVRYTGWLAADGRKFDSSADHPPEPVFDKDLKRVMGEDGKPKMEAGQPILFLQGRPGMIPGWDLGFEGMKVGGKRRLFIPYQMAYGAAGRPSNDPSHPGIPPKADLIFDVELVDMMDIPKPPQGGMRPAPGGAPQPGGNGAGPGGAQKAVPPPMPNPSQPSAQPSAPAQSVPPQEQPK